MGVQKTSAKKPDNYMASRMSYKPGGGIYSPKSPLERRKEYNEQVAERARKAAEAERERASKNPLKGWLESASNELDTLLAKIQADALKKIAIEKDGYEVKEWGTDENGRPYAKSYVNGKGPENVSNVKMNGSDTPLYSASANESKYQGLITKYAQKYDLDPNMVASIITIESAWNPNAVSSANCQGLMQVNPKYNEGNLYDVETNLDNGCRIFRECLNACDGDVAHALVSYNMGITGAKNTPTSSYSDKVIAEYNRRTGLAQNDEQIGSRLDYNV